MPTNLPALRKQKPDESRDTLLTVLFGVVRLAVILAVAIIIWSFIANR
jgi:nitrate reductase NapE component